jgi:hypothetical protein
MSRGRPRPAGVVLGPVVRQRSTGGGENSASMPGELEPQRVRSPAVAMETDATK